MQPPPPPPITGLLKGDTIEDKLQSIKDIATDKPQLRLKLYADLLQEAKFKNPDSFTAIFESVYSISDIDQQKPLLKQMLTATDNDGQTILYQIAPKKDTKSKTVTTNRRKCFDEILTAVKKLSPGDLSEVINQQDNEGKTVLLRIMEYQSAGFVRSSGLTEWTTTSSQKMKTAILAWS